MRFTLNSLTLDTENTLYTSKFELLQIYIKNKQRQRFFKFVFTGVPTHFPKLFSFSDHF